MDSAGAETCVAFTPAAVSEVAVTEGAAVAGVCCRVRICKPMSSVSIVSPFVRSAAELVAFDNGLGVLLSPVAGPGVTFKSVDICVGKDDGGA